MSELKSTNSESLGIDDELIKVSKPMKAPSMTARPASICRG